MARGNGVEEETNAKNDGYGDVVAYVGKGVTFKGELKNQGTVKIDGHVEGEIEASGQVVVGAEAVVRAQIKADTIVCHGDMAGDIVAFSKIDLRSAASVNGTVRTPRLQMEDGVVLNATVEMAAAQEISAVRPLARVAR